MAGKLQLTNYVSDDGNTYHIAEDASNAAAVSATATTLPARRTLPSGYVPRHIWVVDDADVTGGRTPTHARRKIAIGAVGSAFWVGGSTTVTLPDFSVTPSVSVAWTIVSYVGEKRFNR